MTSIRRRICTAAVVVALAAAGGSLGCGGASRTVASDRTGASRQSPTDRALPSARTTDDETDGPTAPRRSPEPPIETRESPQR